MNEIPDHKHIFNKKTNLSITQWFSPKEKLPIEGEEVLGVDSRDEIFQTYFLCTVNVDGEWIDTQNDQLPNIDHWTYLPKFEK